MARCLYLSSPGRERRGSTLSTYKWSLNTRELTIDTRKEILTSDYGRRSIGRNLIEDYDYAEIYVDAILIYSAWKGVFHSKNISGSIAKSGTLKAHLDSRISKNLLVS